mmetsp:Transcript_8508/g.22239  ORF Transcript_8508/g.22239 Transcript_8508/m.22239 type:complete len:422 (+) Transcript_8508:175-1440(+)
MFSTSSNRIPAPATLMIILILLSPTCTLFSSNNELLPLQTDGSTPCKFNSSLQCYSLMPFCSAVDRLGVRFSGKHLRAAFARPGSDHTSLSILVHTFASHITSFQNVRTYSDFWQTTRVHSLPESYRLEGHDLADSVLNSALPHMLHGFTWQAVMNAMQEAASLAVCVGCDFNASAFSETVDHICPFNSRKECAHGVGHGTMLASLYLSRGWEVNPCLPLKYHQVVISRQELQLALEACRNAFKVGLDSVCASGVYHTYTSFYPKVPEVDRWRIPCDQMDSFSEACFMFAMQNYDGKASVRNAPGSLVSPSRCLVFPMISEGAVRGCIFVAAAQMSLFQLPLDSSCHAVASSSPGRLRNERWATCWASSLHYLSSKEFGAKCSTASTREPALAKLMMEVCQSRVDLLQWKVYPARLLQGPF